MYTSYFANKKVSNPVSICAKSPSWYTGPEFKLLAPKYSFLKLYKDGQINEDEYTNQYYNLVLSKLDAAEVYNKLVTNYGEDVSLLCYEKPTDFCHRHIVSIWFEMELNIIVKELI